jgi:SAM-dependent methyltransferase
MGDLNQRAFVLRHRDRFLPPFLEAGAREAGAGPGLRTAFPGADWLGVDQEAGPGVDLVLDLSRPFDEVDAALGARRFATVFCTSVLEHCREPFRMAASLTRLLRPGGWLYVSVPFAWRFHGYPSDYWRFTHEGVRLLFPGLRFDERAGAASAAKEGAFGPLDETAGRLRVPRWLRPWFGSRYVLAPTMLHLLGTPAP